MDAKIKELKEIKVMYLSTLEGSSRAPKLFFQLEKLVGLKGRKFYGVFWQTTGEYYAATKIKEGDNPESLGLKTGLIPGGLYACETLKGRYNDLIRMIAPTFEKLSQKYPIDPERPSIEYYKKFTEFALYLPITNLVK
jgi:DNA gyrase inhibitor GyrI